MLEKLDHPHTLMGFVRRIQSPLKGQNATGQIVRYPKPGHIVSTDNGPEHKELVLGTSVYDAVIPR